MKFVLLLAAVVACALAAPVDEKTAEVVRQESDIQPDGSFRTGYQTSNGISAQEQGELREGRDEKNNVLQFVARSGSFEYVDPEGKSHSIKWFADENGYRAEGADVPVAA